MGGIGAAAGQVAGVLAPVFLLAAIGAVWARRGIEFPSAFVARLALSLATPALLFATLARAEFPAEELGALLGASAAAWGLAAAAIWAGLRLAGLDPRVWLVALVNGNTGNLGLPVALFALGEAGLTAAMAVFAVQAVLTFTVGLWLVSGAARWRELAGQPIFWGAAAGLAAGLAGWQPPAPAMRTLDLIGQLAIPLMLLSLGVSVARMRVRGAGRAAVLSLARLLPCGAAGWAAAAAFGLGPVAAQVLMLQMLMPAAVTSLMLAERHGRDPAGVGALVAVSNLLSAGYLAVALPLVLR